MTQAAIRAVIFDFDGTLADAYRGIAASVNHVRGLHGLGRLELSEVRRHVGRGPAHLMAHTVPGVEVDRAVADYRAHHPSVMRTGTKLMPGALESLRALKQAGCLTAVCSNKPALFTGELLDHLGLAELVDVLVGPEDVPRPKPAPDMLTMALKRLEVRPENALYVGDMVVDIETARAAGVSIWVVPTGSEERAQLEGAGPDRVLDSLVEIIRFFA